MKTADAATVDSPSGRIALIECSAQSDTDPASREIRARGGLPLLVGNSILAEISRAELEQGIAAAGELTQADLARLSGDLARQLRNAIEAGGDTADLAETAGNAAALFVLCLKQNGIDASSGLAPCSVNYDAASREVVLEHTA